MWHDAPPASVPVHPFVIVKLVVSPEMLVVSVPDVWPPVFVIVKRCIVDDAPTLVSGNERSSSSTSSAAGVCAVPEIIATPVPPGVPVTVSDAERVPLVEPE